ncbi:MAG TPA: hypothetical protein VM223_16360 [Planctomycetota bacterium]|nr:hypothetical protein [Planctomycetota bacterium]
MNKSKIMKDMLIIRMLIAAAVMPCLAAEHQDAAGVGSRKRAAACSSVHSPIHTEKCEEQAQ